MYRSKTNRGVILAVRDCARGKKIMMESPLLSISQYDTALTVKDTWEHYQNAEPEVRAIVDKIEFLPHMNVANLLEELQNDANNDTFKYFGLEHAARTIARLRSKNLDFSFWERLPGRDTSIPEHSLDPSPDHREVFWQCLFQDISDIGQSCRPNAHWSFDVTTMCMQVHAIDPIKKDEPITFSWVSQLESAKERNDALLAIRGMPCACLACKNPETSDPNRDTLRRYEHLRIHLWQRKGESETPASPSPLSLSEMPVIWPSGPSVQQERERLDTECATLLGSELARDGNELGALKVLLERMFELLREEGIYGSLMTTVLDDLVCAVCEMGIYNDYWPVADTAIEAFQATYGNDSPVTIERIAEYGVVKPQPTIEEESEGRSGDSD